MSLPIRVRSWKRSQKYAFIKKTIEQEFKSFVSESSSSSDNIISDEISDNNEISNENHLDISQDLNYNNKACSVIELSNSSCEDSMNDFCSDTDLLDDTCEYTEKNHIPPPVSTPEVTISDVLKTYAIQCNVPRSNLRVLMNLLQPIHNELPKDPRTILKGPTKVLVEPMGTREICKKKEDILLNNGSDEILTDENRELEHFTPIRKKVKESQQTSLLMNQKNNNYSNLQSLKKSDIENSDDYSSPSNEEVSDLSDQENEGDNFIKRKKSSLFDGNAKRLRHEGYNEITLADIWDKLGKITKRYDLKNLVHDHSMKLLYI
ncbi:hypothetical protein HCN44_007189 [Aphidius gifuensis]|uniref:Uncharacterized protein n=1 Tax=Aphidius gifuensis TaxID=684658 RepID=A0A835CMW5_APHGI|nr:hypothetical protein HCN44_007189 [Aphidius gifuensis]